MKTNTRKWYRVVAHDFFDELPEISYRLFDSPDNAEQYEEHMNNAYSGGSTKVESNVTKEEILKYIEGIDIDEVTLANINNDDYYN